MFHYILLELHVPYLPPMIHSIDLIQYRDCSIQENPQIHPKREEIQQIHSRERRNSPRETKIRDTTRSQT